MIVRLGLDGAGVEERWIWMDRLGVYWVDVDYWRENVVVVVVGVDGSDKVDGRDEGGQITLRGKDVTEYG